MVMLRNLILSVSVIGLLASCSIEESTSFNADFSGKSTTKVDMTAMIQFMSSMDSTGEGKAKFYREIQQGMDSVKNSKENDLNLEMKFDTVTNAMSVTFAFKSLDDANNTAKKLREKQSPGTSSTPLYRWEKKDKVLVMPGLEDMSKLTGGGGGGGSNPMLNGMTYTMVRTFPKSIVKVSDSRISLSADKKTMTFKATADELTKNPLKEITVTFK
jgi:hypothetical protein